MTFLDFEVQNIDQKAKVFNKTGFA